MVHRHLDIIVPIYKNAGLVRACVDSLLQHIDEISAFEPRLVLINDSPDDVEVAQLLLEYAGQSTPCVKLMANAQNMGFVRTVNQGLALALKDHRDALLVNSDTITFAGTLANIIS